MQELVQGGFLLLVDILLVEMAEVMMDDDCPSCWEGRMQLELLVEMAEVMMDDDCLSRWEGQMQLQIEHLDGEYFDPHPDVSPSWLVES
jgi:hypothetical protein